MSDKIKFYSRTGYGEWNEKVVGKAKQFCVLCKDALDVLYRNGVAIWTDGHNAEPLSVGRCCNFCNDTKVKPARLRSIQKGGLSFEERERLLNEHSNPVSLTDMQNRLNKLLEGVREDG
tara:strand:- start:2999 stop:3355 length:357 start_codon:yes stop_codon:yes gene_type:complete